MTVTARLNDRSSAGLILIVAGAVVALDLALIVIGGPAIGILAFLVLPVTVVFVRFPGVLLAAYLLLAFYKGGVQPYSPVDVTLILATLNTLQIIPVIRDRRARPISTSGVILWIALSLLVVAGILYAPDQDLAVDRAIRWWALVVPPILAGGLRVGSDPRYLRQFLWSFFGMGVLTVGLGLTQLSDVERLTVLNANTIQVARAALIVPLLGIAFVLHGRYPLPKLALLFLVPAALVVALASGSRGPVLILAILAGLGLLRYLSQPHSLDWGRVGGAALLAIASVALTLSVASALPGAALSRFALLGEFVSSGLSGGLTTSVGDTSAGNRVVLFEAAGDMFANHPLLGVGTSGFEALSPRYLSPDELEAWPHNAVLQVAAEFGLVGLALAIGLVTIAFTRRLPPGPASTALRVLFAFFFLNAMVSGDIFSDRETWGLLMLLLLIEAPKVARVAPRPILTAIPISRPRPAHVPSVWQPRP